jgi:hypothetical protein
MRGRLAPLEHRTSESEWTPHFPHGRDPIPHCTPPHKRQHAVGDERTTEQRRERHTHTHASVLVAAHNSQLTRERDRQHKEERNKKGPEKKEKSGKDDWRVHQRGSGVGGLC